MNNIYNFLWSYFEHLDVPLILILTFLLVKIFLTWLGSPFFLSGWCQNEVFFWPRWTVNHLIKETLGNRLWLNGCKRFNDRYQYSWKNAVMNKLCDGEIVKSQLINGDIVKPQQNVFRNKMNILTCPYINFPRFDLIRFNLKHCRPSIFILDFLHGLFQGFFRYSNFPFFKCITLSTGIP